MNVDLKDVQGSEEDPMKVDVSPTVPNADVVAKARNVGEQAEDAREQARDVARQSRDPKEVVVKGEGVAQHAESIPSSEDLLMTIANSADPVHPKVTKEPGDQILLSFPNVIPSNPPLDSTKPEKIPQTNLESARMNVEVVDDTMLDLDPFSRAPKVGQWSP